MKWSIGPENLFTLSCDNSVSGPEESRKPLAEFWGRVCREITDHYLDNGFKVIFCELWPDSGRIIVYPSDRSPVNGKVVHRRNDRVCLQVCFPWLLTRYDELPDPDTRTRDFEKASKALSKVVQQLLAETVREPEVSQMLELLRVKAPFRICIDDCGSLHELRLVPGKPAITKWKDEKNRTLSAEEQAIEFFSGLKGHSVDIQRDMVYGVNLHGSKVVTDQDLARLLVFPKLEKLELQDTAITDAGLEEIGKLLTLRQLHLSGTKITDAGLRHLWQLKKLWKLNVWRTAVTTEGIDSLKVALPTVKVET